MEEDKELGDRGALDAAIRSAKRSKRPSKIGVLAKRPGSHPKEKNKSRKGGSFDNEMGQGREGKGLKRKLKQK